jgi:hypothetical protein
MFAGAPARHGADRNPADFVPLGRQNGQKPD